MNLTDTLSITHKGRDELKNRTYRLSLKKRSVLILLEAPRSVQQIVEKAVFPLEEVIAEITALLENDFVEIQGASHSTIHPALRKELELHEDIILPEARFRLIDFCTDHFGNHAQHQAAEIRACPSAKSLSAYLVKLVTEVQKNHPQLLPELLALVKEAKASL